MGHSHQSMKRASRKTDSASLDRLFPTVNPFLQPPRALHVLRDNNPDLDPRAMPASMPCPPPTIARPAIRPAQTNPFTHRGFLVSSDSTESDDHPVEARIALDTQAQVNVMRVGIFQQLRRLGYQLESEAQTTPLRPFGATGNNGVVPLGIVRNVNWYYRVSARTFTADFHVVTVGHPDVLIGGPSIARYNLLERSPEIPRIIERDLSRPRPGIVSNNE